MGRTVQPLQTDPLDRHRPASALSEAATFEVPYDARFRSLAGPETWAQLPDAVQRRFSKRLQGVEVALYRGIVTQAESSPLGWCLAQACRLIGAPLPLGVATGAMALVVVSEDLPTGGQCWTRIYGRPFGFPQVIHSAKRFAGPTGLEEYLGRGVGMALRVTGIDQGIAFVSDHYFLQVGGWRVRLPQMLSPGRTTVIHRDIGGGAFEFELSLDHPLAGMIIHQKIRFEDAG
jgi:hypothetical protein